MALLARQALQIRAWTLHVLAGQPAPPRLAAGVRSWDPLAWRCVLDVERCALPLQARLDTSGMITQLPRSVAELLRARAVGEMQRVRMATRQLNELGAAAAKAGISLVVLEGGVAALDAAHPVDLDKLDLLVPGVVAREMAVAAESLGYRAIGEPGADRLAPRTRPSSFALEIHLTTHSSGEALDADSWSRVRPIPGAPGLSQLGGAEQLMYVVERSAVDDPQRRGSVRDLLLAGQAVLRCSQSELEQVRRWVQGHPSSTALRAVIALARSLQQGRVSADGLAQVAATNYLMHGLADSATFPQELRVSMGDCVSALIGGRGGHRRLWEATWSPKPRPRRREYSTLERTAPTFHRGWSVSRQLGHLAASYAASCTLMGAARVLREV
ncbi:MAG: nucleotidyltransferase family protein [Gemmatimonadota bacterium]|nr:nucleotidyltransferase family protein [Gemmatimonadota bacterium]